MTEQSRSLRGKLVEFFKPGELVYLQRPLVVWFVLFAFFNQFFQGPYSKLSEWMAAFATAVNLCGLIGALLWTWLYDKPTLVRLARCLLAIAIVCLIAPLTGGVEFDDMPDLMLITLLVSLTGMIPAWGIRRLLNWRILRSADEYRPIEFQFKISHAMLWTTFFAVVLVMARIVADSLDEQDLARMLLWVLLSVFLSAVPILVFLLLVSRLRGIKLFAAMPVLGSLITGAYLIIGVYVFKFPPPPTNSFSFFFEMITWFTAMGWIFALAATHLRRRGLILAFGLSPAAIRRAEQESTVEAVLESRIRETKRVHAWLEFGSAACLSAMASASKFAKKQLAARQSRLEVELETLISQPPESSEQAVQSIG